MDILHLLLAVILGAALVVIFHFAARAAQAHRILDEVIDEVAEAEAGKLTMEELHERLRQRGVGQ